MANAERTAVGTDAGALVERIRQLDDQVIGYHEAGDHPAANAAKARRDAARRELALIALALDVPTTRAPLPVEQVGVTVREIVDLLAAVGEALQGRDPAAIDWTASVIEAVLAGRQDAAFAASFLRAQAARLRAGATASEVDGAD